MSENFPDAETRDVMRSLHAAGGVDDNASTAHLDDSEIAALADGVEPANRTVALTHLSRCTECRDRLTAVSNLLDDPAVVSAIPVQPMGTKRRSSAARWGAFAALAAAAVFTIVLVRPREARDVSVQREQPGATTPGAVAPRILSSPELDQNHKQLRWTSVAGADLYRVRIWNPDGTVVWSTEIPDTVISIPEGVLRAGSSYLWEVDARTGWDRWTSSEFSELRVQPERR